MPTYEYRCKSCGYVFEEFQPMTAEPLAICPKCAKPSLKRLLGTGAGLMFKGSGFYLTDYKNKTNSSSESTAKTTGETKKEAKTDAKQSSEASGKKETKEEKKKD